MKSALFMTMLFTLISSSSCTVTNSAQRVTAAPRTETMKALVRRFYEEAWNRGEMAVIEELFAPQYTRHNPGAEPAIANHEDQRKSAGAQRTMFPDFTLHIDYMIAEGDRVAARWTIRGSNTGPRGKNPPTGKSVKYSGINIFRFENGKVVELWNHRDDLSLMRQLDGAPAVR